MKARKKLTVLVGALLLVVGLAACGNTNKKEETTKSEPKTEKKAEKKESKEDTDIMVAAAASLEYSYTEKLIPMFEKENPGIKVKGTYDSSGKLQTQIEQGMDADLFMSAAPKQMTALVDQDLIEKDSVVDLLENKVVLIKGKDTKTDVDSFESIDKAKTVAIGDPESVPAGQYAKEVLTNMGTWDAVTQKASLGTNVTEVLNWVSEGSADVGIVYATDAATTDKVEVIAEAPASSLKEKVIYPIGIVKASKHQKEAQKFEDFLGSKEALKVFEDYGFTPNK